MLFSRPARVALDAVVLRDVQRDGGVEHRAAQRHDADRDVNGGGDEYAEALVGNDAGAAESW